jgi:predicted secreted protein
MAITGVAGAIWNTSGASTLMTAEPTTKNGIWTIYAITNQAHRYIDDSVVCTVLKNAVVQSTGFTIQYAGGNIVFNPPLISTDVVTVTANYFTIAQCLSVFGWKMDISMDLKDVTTFQSNGWKEQIAGIGSWSASADGYWLDGHFSALVNSGVKMIMAFYVDDISLKRYEGYVFIKKDSIDEAVDGVVKESIDLEGTGQIFYHEG